MKNLLIFAVVIVMSVDLGSARGIECTSAGCSSYDANGNGLYCGPNGCGRTGSGNSYPQFNRNDQYYQPRGGSVVSCGPDGCKGFQDRGNGYGCGPQGCGPL